MTRFTKTSLHTQSMLDTKNHKLSGFCVNNDEDNSLWILYVNLDENCVIALADERNNKNSFKFFMDVLDKLYKYDDLLVELDQAKHALKPINAVPPGFISEDFALKLIAAAKGDEPIRSIIGTEEPTMPYID